MVSYLNYHYFHKKALLYLQHYQNFSIEHSPITSLILLHTNTRYHLIPVEYHQIFSIKNYRFGMSSSLTLLYLPLINCRMFLQKKRHCLYMNRMRELVHRLHLHSSVALSRKQPQVTGKEPSCRNCFPNSTA